MVNTICSADTPKSASILGRARSRNAFAKWSRFTVSAYETSKGQRRFTDPIEWFSGVPKPSVVYRIIVKPRRPTR